MIQEVVYITNQKEIPKDYAYDTETNEFWVYRNKYTGKELHLAKTPPLYVDVSKAVLQALEDVRAEIDKYDEWMTEELSDLIDRKIEEIKNDKIQHVYGCRIRHDGRSILQRGIKASCF